MTRTCAKLIDYCFTTLNLNGVEIKCATDHLKSQAIPERLNFNREGILRQAQLVNNLIVDQYL